MEENELKKLSKKIFDYARRTKLLYPPLLSNEWGVELESITLALCRIWNSFDRPRVTERGGIAIGYDRDPNLYEVCNTKYQRGRIKPKHNISEYSYLNQRKDQHISVFAHDDNWIQNYRETGKVSCQDTYVKCDWIYLELDRESLVKAIEDSIKIINNFPYPESIQAWYSGNKSIHLAVDARLFGSPVDKQKNVCGIGKLFYNLAHKIAGDIRHNNGVADIWTKPNSEVDEIFYNTFGVKSDEGDKKQKLENIDPNLYRVNSLIRQPFSIHESGGKKKLHIPHDKLSEKKIKIQPKKFDFFQNFSYPYLLHWIYECYEPKVKPKKITPVQNTNLIINTFSQAFEYFDELDSNEDGWVKQLYSPFYEDTNPSVAVNINNGYYHDFGEPTHSFGFVDFYSKFYNIEKSEAIKKCTSY